MSKNLVRDSLETRVYGEHEQRITHEEKLVDGEFVYVGTYPGGADTTPDSPVFKNGWQSSDVEPLRFRWLLDGRPDIRGKFTGGVEDTVVFTLPIKARPDNSYTIPYVDNNDCVGAITIEADGDVVWHDTCGAGAGGTLEQIMTAKSTLRGWWRLGENPNAADLLADDFPFANSAPGFGAYPLVVYDYTHFGGALSLMPNGLGSASLTVSDDGALLSPNVTGNRIKTPIASDYGQYFMGNAPWTMACWFLPGYDPDTSAPSEFGAFGRGHVCGPLTMEGSGSANLGVGFVWRPFYNDPGQAGPSLQLWRMGGVGLFTQVVVPINTAGVKVTNWWSTHGYFDNPFLSEPEVISVTIPQSTYQPWFHIAATYDGTNIRTYVNGLLANTTASAWAMAALGGEDFHIVSARIDTGVTEFDGELLGAVDEVAVWSEMLTGGEILQIAQAT